MSGATRGIGRVAATAILAGAPDVHLVLLARSDSRSIAAELRAASGNPNVSTTQVDLASLASIRTATATLRDDFARGILPPLAGLVGNAGLQLLRATDASADGVEMTFAVNVLANHVLVEELRSSFTAPARIVITASDTHFGDFRHNLGLVPAPQWRDPAALATPGMATDPDSAKAGRRAYSTSKLAVIHLVHDFARRLASDVDVFSFNPGLVPGTDLARDGGAAARFAFTRILPAMTLTPWARSVQVSGRDLSAAVIGPVPGPTGSYINGAKVEASSPSSYDRRREDDLRAELGRLGARHATPSR